MPGGLIFGSDIPTAGDNSDGTSYTMGTKFRPDVDGVINVHWYAPVTPPGAFNAAVVPVQVQLWDDLTASIINSGAFPSSTPAGWNSLGVSWPVLANKDYVASVVTDRYAATSHYFDSPKVNGHITAPVSAGKFWDLGPSSVTPVYPNQAFNAGGYFIDIDFTPAGSSPTVSVWNGTSEITGCSVSVWNGTSEVAASVGSVV